MDDGNAAAIRAVAQTLFDTWKAEQEHAANQEQKRLVFGGSVPAWITAAMAILAVVLVAGGTNERVNGNSRRIDVLEASDREQNQQSSAIMGRLGSMDAKIDYLIDGGKR